MILIVDDNLDTCRALVRLLAQAGVPAQCTDDPKAALGLVRLLKPELVVLDQMMPGLLGTDVLRTMRSIPEIADIPALFYSAARHGEDEARRLGAEDWLVKGRASWDELKERVLRIYHSRLGRDIQN
jgi:CheY-like chemotaxis protein